MAEVGGGFNSDSMMALTQRNKARNDAAVESLERELSTCQAQLERSNREKLDAENKLRRAQIAVPKALHDLRAVETSESMLSSIRELETDLVNAREETRKYKSERDKLARDLEERASHAHRVEVDYMNEVMRLKSDITKQNEVVLNRQNDGQEALRLARERELQLLSELERSKQDKATGEAKAHAERQGLLRQNSLTEERRLKASQEFEDMVAQQARMSDKWREENKSNEKRFERTVRELKDDNTQLRSRLDELNLQLSHVVGERSAAVQQKEDVSHELQMTTDRAIAMENMASDFQGKITAMLEDKAKLLAQTADLENKAEQLGLERDRAARACEAAVARLTENASQFNETAGLGEDEVQKVRDAEVLIASLMQKCVSLKKGKEHLKKKVRRLEGKENTGAKGEDNDL